MKATRYLFIFVILLAGLFSLLLQVDRLGRLTKAFEALVVLGYIFISIIMLAGFKNDWEWVNFLGILFFSFTLLNLLFIHFFTRQTGLMFIGVLVSMIGLIFCIENRPKDSVEREPKIEIVQAERPDRSKYVASTYGKSYHTLRCQAVKNMLKKNKVFFKTKAEAGTTLKPHSCIE